MSKPKTPVTVTAIMPDQTTRTWNLTSRPRYIGSFLLRNLPEGTDIYAVRYTITPKAGTK